MACMKCIVTQAICMIIDNATKEFSGKPQKALKVSRVKLKMACV